VAVRRARGVGGRLAGLAAAAALGLGACAPGARDVQVRPLRVRVVDAATKRPLEGVPVSYALQAMVMRRVLGLWPAPIAADIGPRVVAKVRGTTDAAGEVELRAGTVRLRADERLYEEFVLVNLEVDMAERLAQVTLEAEESGCRGAGEHRATCPAERADAVDVALRALQLFEEDRVRLFVNPDARRRGVVVVTEPPDARREGYRDWTTPQDRFRVRFEFARLTGSPATLAVALEPAPRP
jgi:hypothetical protein